VSGASIVGTYHTRFGAFVDRNRETGEVLDRQSIYQLLVEAGRGAIADAGLEGRDVDAVWVGSCSPSLFTSQEHLAPIAVEIDPDGLAHRPMTRTEAACASSSVALYGALHAIEAGRCRTALVIGVEKMNLLSTREMTRALACSTYWPEEGGQGMTFPGVFAELGRAYAAHHRLATEPFARMRAEVSAQAYRNGARNPVAHFGAGGFAERHGLFSADAILALPTEGPGANVTVAEPLRLHDCSPVTDGAAALVLTSTENARRMRDPVVEIAGIGQATERMPLSRRPALHRFDGAAAAARRAYEEAGIEAGDLDLAEVHDCFSVAQLLCTEAMGLSAEGRAGFDYLEQRFAPGTRCPVNLSGGLKAKGHPVGATGASMHVHLYRQLAGDPLGAPHGGEPTVGALLNVGGAGVTNCVTVLRRLR
jgi:acetyl-CoA C-acetyltransferase